MTKQLFVDLDGVLADFDGFVLRQFGLVNTRETRMTTSTGETISDSQFWKIVNKYEGRLFYDMRPMPYAHKLWRELKKYNPIILTGVPDPTGKLANAADDKRQWVREFIDEDVKVVACKSRNKRDYGKPGDILLDDWPKYKHLWEEMGGKFLIHHDVDLSIAAVTAVMVDGS